MIYVLISILLIACTERPTKIQNEINSEITENKNNFPLDSIFPIENILSITVTNYNGEHTLTEAELAILKSQLKGSNFAGGLLIKPGHITLSISLKDETIAKSGFVYASTGSIHFEGGVDKFNKNFSGTFHLPTKLNFDDYK